MVKRILKKILLIILIVLILNNFFMTKVMAAEPLDTVVGVIEGILGGIVGILSFPFRLVAITIGDAVNGLTAIIAYTEKPTDTSIDTGTLTPFDILFNKVPILDINFFEIDDEENIVNQIRTGVATWYYVLRILASAILLVILVYVGIRMAISTVASDRAMYKKMLVDWVCSLALIFVIQYIIVFTININNALVNAMSVTSDSREISEAFDVIKEEAMKVFSLDAVGATVVYCMLVWQTIGLLISYFNRMLKIAFLIIISPLITLTYSIDKMGDGKAQALGKWLKEFVFTILMQPFHCIIYMCLINIAIKMLVENVALGGAGSIRDSLATALVAILCIRFVKEAEKIVRKIFAFQDDNSGTSLVAGMAASAVVLSNAKKFGRGARSTVNNVKNIGKNGLAMARTARVEARALGILMSSSEDKSFTEAKQEAKIQLNNEKAEKINKKLNKKQERMKGAVAGAKEFKEATDKEVKKRTQEIIDRNGGAIDKDEAESQAKLELAKERRTKRGPVRSRISRAKGRISDAKEYINSFETIKELTDDLRIAVSGGAALMVGSGVYGTQGNIATAISAGAATGLGMQEFLKSSSNTIMTSFRENMRNLGVNSPEKATEMWYDIMDNKDKYGDLSSGSKAEEELDKILKELSRISGHSKEEIKGDVTNILNKPDAAPNELSDYLRTLNSNADLTKITEGKALLDFANKHAIVTRVENSKEIMSESQIRNRLIEGYSKNRVYIEEKKEEANEDNFIKELKIEDIRGDSPKHNDDNIELSDQAMKIVQDKYEEQIAKIRDKIEEAKKDGDTEKEEEYKFEQQKLQAEMANIISRALSNKNIELEGKSLKMAKDYSDKLQEEINSMKNIQNNISSYSSNIQDNFNKNYQQLFSNRINQLKHAKALLDNKINESNSHK